MKKKNTIKEEEKPKQKFNFFEKLNQSSDKIYLYFIIPSLVLMFLTFLEENFKYTGFNFALKITIAILFTVWVAFVLFTSFKKIIKVEIVWPLVVSFVFFIYAYFLYYNDNSSYGNIVYCIGIFFLEVYILYTTFYSVFCLKNKLNVVILLCIAFVVIGYVTIVFASYGTDNNTIFNSLITIFSAIVGGGLTLGGVAWTIKSAKQEEEKKEIKKAKPIFDYSLILEEPKILSGMKTCFSDEEYNDIYKLKTRFLIDNSDCSVFKLNKIFHDNKWFNLTGNTIVLPKRVVVFEFLFNNPEKIYLEAEDSLGNFYYYKIAVLSLASLKKGKLEDHTIRTMNELSKEELENEISNRM